MSKFPLQAGLWYNEALELLYQQDAVNTLLALTNLLGRFVLDTVSPSASNGNPPQKRCIGPCGRLLPATPEFFHRNKDGFQHYCKQCRSVAKPKENPPAKGFKQCSRCKRNLPATSDYFGERSAYRGRKARFYSHCKQCKAAGDRSYREKHAGYVRESKKQYRVTHRAEYRQYVALHKGHIDEMRRRNNEANRARISNRQKHHHTHYYQSERGRIQMRVSSTNRRARKRNAQGTYTTEELYQQLQRQKNTCYYCQRILGKERRSWAADHVIPLSRGGTNTIDNIVIACHSCNLSKQNKLLHEWGKGGRLL